MAKVRLTVATVDTSHPNGTIPGDWLFTWGELEAPAKPGEPAPAPGPSPQAGGDGPDQSQSMASQGPEVTIDVSAGEYTARAFRRDADLMPLGAVVYTQFTVVEDPVELPVITKTAAGLSAVQIDAP